MNCLNKFERKHPKFGISNLMIYLVVAMLFVYVFDRAMPNQSLSSLLYFDSALILEGQVWRLITFIFLPPASDIVFIIFALYFNYLIGTSLEIEWGTCTFTIYYIIGIIGAIISGFITGSTTNVYLNLSLFFAFAILFPDFQIMLFFILPIKIKYLAFLNGLYFIVELIIGSWSQRAAIIASLINLIIFFSGTFIQNIKRQTQYRKTRKNFRQQNRSSKFNSRDMWN